MRSRGDQQNVGFLVDTHAHLNFKVYENNWREVVEKAILRGVKKIIVVGTDLDSSKKAVEMAREHEVIFAAVGLHPHHAKQYLKLSSDRVNNLVDLHISEIKQMVSLERVVAVGEIGLDDHKYNESKYQLENSEAEQVKLTSLQQKLFVEQVRLAQFIDKPVIIHSREVKENALEVLKQIEEDVGKKVRGVFHCFEGSKKYASQVIEAGYCISFTGNITYAFDRAEVAKTVPLERLLLETDSPYMTPQPDRNLVNTPGNVRIVASHHAKDRDLSVKEIMRSTTINALRLFGLKD